MSLTVQRAAVVALVREAGFDPLLNVGGSFFPSWIVCMLLGGVLTALARQLLSMARLEPYLGPPLLVYSSLGLLLTMLTWLLLYRT